MEGIFTVSLDFELHWGVFDKKNRDARKNNYENTRRLVPEMLELFSKHGVHVTWATVGSLFAGDEKEWYQMKPANEPVYENPAYSAYHYVKLNGLDQKVSWAHFAPDLVAKILEYPGQELGTHTFSHYYCLERLRGEDAFEADLKAVQRAAAKYNTEMRSLVFPRNQFNPQHLKACYKHGIRTIRSNPSEWFWSPVADGGGSLIRKIFRTGDAYLPMSSNRTSFALSSLKTVKNEPLQVPASRFLRPWHPRYKAANKLALNRVMSEMKKAAVNKECYHLWWHPENFGDYPEQNMENLRQILNYYSECKRKHGMKSWNMDEYAIHFELSL
ncbi:MAG: polysaccharide deacetylase [Chitinophagaceae bacterium]|nr:MAG: polysaccharide deacetylase [Chitinophagaceae bacterium]